MMAADDIGYDFNFQSDGNNFGGFFDDIVDAGNDDDVIDMDSFLSILDEDLPDLPINPFYPSVDCTQEGLPAVHVGNNDRSHFQRGYGTASESSAETVEVLNPACFASSPDIFLSEANEASFGKNITEPGLQCTHKVGKTECFPSTQNCYSIYDISAGNPTDGMENGMVLTNDAVEDVVKYDLDDSKSSRSWFDIKTTLDTQVGVANLSSSEIPMYGFFDSIPHNSHTVDQVDTLNSLNTFDSSSTTTDEASAEPFGRGLMDQSYGKQDVEMKDEKNGGIVSRNGFEGTSRRTIKEEAYRERLLGIGARKFATSSEAHYSGRMGGHPDDFYHSFSTKLKPTNLPLSNGPVPLSQFTDMYFKKGVDAVVQSATIKPETFDGSKKACVASLSDDIMYIEADDDDDDDVCIIEDLSAPAQMHPLSVPKKSVTLSSHMSTFSPACSPMVAPFNQVGVSAARVKVPDERLIFQAVVQDLSQPMAETNLPDGILEVPLLRHQRIALSWMVQKETTSVQCSGGILADDQGLGKTVSTIALLLTERAPLAKKTNMAVKGELETLDLDGEDDKVVRNRASINAVQSSSVKGRPSGGTLVVCPTSVLRQWGDELKNKVSDKAKLSVCMYHGTNRTKDPYELANYDVVLTTYSIVSMEVPKPAGFKDEKDNLQDDDDTFFNRKRKHSSKSEKRRLKKEMDVLLESSARPLARVNWFRVVLDEAQSIKNYRTQVAQACWGLRAKRRWCLSGTPIQNAVDDLYSYFRFLRYDPYSVYKSFCSMVKIPITKNPSTGYKKLQAVLKTIMLRRTKGTLLDGEPIINLPPKTVKLKKVEFSEEERDFYTKLESDSRAQFQAYADSGTVKQNYVNILLMLLRLRQACDHPFLVKGYGSNPAVKSSNQAAKKLPRERQISLLNCLEASLAICGVCSDPPEDAVVSICGHVFCNQCISERLTGDDCQCPVRKCKTQLNVSSVFSKGALKSCLSVEHRLEGSQIYSDSESFEQAEGVDLASCFNSSKIKAALRVLGSLSKPRISIHDDALIKSSDAGVGNLDKSSSTSSSLVNGSPGVTNGSASSKSGVKEKAIVFSQWTSMLDLLEDGLKICSIQYRRLDGTMSVAARDKAVKDFNTLPEVSVMIMSLKAASLGLNMVAACHVILLDLWWNPTTEDQAIDRAHRIGQTRPVTVVRLTVKDTVEDRILALQQKKRELVASAFGEDETGSQATRLTVEDLKYLFMA